MPRCENWKKLSDETKPTIEVRKKTSIGRCQRCGKTETMFTAPHPAHRRRVKIVCLPCGDYYARQNLRP